MTQHETYEHELGIIDAVETLTSIADLEIDSPIAIAQTHEIEFQELPVIYRTIHWLHRRNAEKVMNVVQDTFRVILHYLKYFYKREYGKLVQHESVEGIKTIMVLVGEAAKKVDKHSQLFAGVTAESIKRTKEFRDLWSFYQRKIAPIAIQESLTKWMSLLPLNVVSGVKMEEAPIREEMPLQKAHDYFLDLDAVKKDDQYELFFIRKEDGTRFFTPHLLRNIKLICNFEEYFGDEVAAAPHVNELRIWKEVQSQFFARNILKASWPMVDRLVKLSSRYRDNEMAMLLYKACVALMLAANQEASMKELVKGSSRYLMDFQKFIRELLASKEFQKLVAYPPKNPNSVSFVIIELVQSLCSTIYSGFNFHLDSVDYIDSLIVKGKNESLHHESFTELDALPLSTRMALEYDALMCAMRHHSNIPLLTTIEELQEEEITNFDPFLLHKLSSAIFDFYLKGKRISVLRMPSPCIQGHIHKAQVADEFKLYLRSLKQANGSKLLLFNLQDRTHWREFARCDALEAFQNNEEFSKCLSVVTMTKDSDFYHQRGPYQDINVSEQFIEQLLEQVQSEQSGYLYPQKIRKALFPAFAMMLAKAIHELFFGKKNVLSVTNRIDFIELFYLLLQLKIIELVQPTAMSFSCKDAIDIGMPAASEFFLLLKFINERKLSEEEEEYVKSLLHSSAISHRGRPLFEERFARVNNLVRMLEGIERADILEKIAPLYDTNILSSVVTIPQL